MSISNFSFYNPTKLIVKHDAAPEIADYIANDGIKSVLLVYGQGSVKRIGVYDKVVAALKSKNIVIHELSGVRANPEIHTVIKGIEKSGAQKFMVYYLLPLYSSVKSVQFSKEELVRT
ncbi:Alcohol_dehydrogenase [Hexamita inflata]|uniref:Alcohol_dehydrogenase n=1 Tax=Hexamita inflata TaxID=28002 RepID=A0ABP1HSA9_9EUKA